MDGDEVYDSLDESISDTSSDEAQEEFHGANELSGEESGKEEEDEEERDRGGNSLNIQFELSDNGSEKDVGETSSVDSNTKRRNRGGRSTPDNFVPLRERSNSDLERFKSRIATSEAAKEAQEMPEKWRKRLWPSNAVISFCRLILRCQPRLNGDDDNVTLRELISHWRTSDLQKLGCAFTSTSAHNSAFFLLVVEECRASFMCSNMDYSSEKYYRRSHRMQGEVHAIVTESEPGGLMQAKDPRLGSVWVVSTAIVHGQSIIGGDLLLLSSSQWDHPVLGIAQPWDPDYDIKFSNTLHFRSQRSVSGIATTDEADDRLIGDNLVDGRKFYVNIMVCVDRSKTVNAIGGWAPQGAIYPGVNLHISILGNLMTSLRECQALMSLRLINQPLQQLLLSTTMPSEGFSSDSNLGKSGIPEKLWEAMQKTFNTSQLRAICNISTQVTALSDTASPNVHPSVAKIGFDAATISLLQGPPGTGKTRTILGVVSALLSGVLTTQRRNSTPILAGASLSKKTIKPVGDNLKNTDISSKTQRQARILICAPSNIAIDEIVYRLKTQGVLGPDGKKRDDLSIVRVGLLSSEEVSSCLNRHDPARASRGVAREDGRPMDPVMAHILESTYLDVMVEERRRDLQATNLRALTGKWKVGDIRKNILDQADIVCCTLSGAGSQPVLEVVLRITGFKFDAVIIDEAAQATEPLSLIPFKYNPKVVVMVGDPCQLPAIVFSSKAKNCNYDQSLFQRLQRLGHPVSMLETQYRMHPDIAQYSSARFYNNFLKTDSNILLSSSHVKPYHVHESGRYRPIVFHNIAYGVEFVTGSSIQNAEEAKYVLLLHKDLVKHYPEHAKDIGIIAPYQAQRKLLMSMFKSCVEPIDADAVEISTIDGFQGREKGIIILSCVRSARRSKGRGGIGFLQDWQRLNVAITRAKYSLWIVGNAETLQNHQEWATLIKYIKQDKRNFITHSRPPLSIGEKIPTVPVNNNFSRQNNSRLRDRQRRDDRRSNSRGNRDNRNFESRDGKGKSDRMQSIDRRNSRSKYEQPSDTSMKDVIANDPVAPGVAATTYSPSYRKPSENQQTNGTSSASAPLPPASIPHSNVDSHVELYNGDSRRIDRFKPTVRPPTPNVPSLAQPSHKRFNDVSSDVQSANRFARKYNFNGYDTKRHRHF